MYWICKSFFLAFSGLCIGLTWAGTVSAGPAGLDAATEFAGHLKYRFNYQRFPADSLYREALGSSALDQYLEARHPQVLGDVMRRLLAADDASHLRGEPRLWCAVLDDMAAELRMIMRTETSIMRRQKAAKRLKLV